MVRLVGEIFESHCSLVEATDIDRMEVAVLFCTAHVSTGEERETINRLFVCPAAQAAVSRPRD